jgi:hypothetical protein
MERSLLGRLASVWTIKGMRDLMRTQPATMAAWVRNVRAVEEALGSDEALSYTRLLLAEHRPVGPLSWPLSCPT